MQHPTGDEWYTRHNTERRKGWVENGIAYLPATQGKITLLDPEFLERVERRQWSYSHGYVMRRESNGPRTYLHHLVWELAGRVRHYHTDHINMNALDNRLVNLRDVPRWQNQINRPLQSNNTSGYRGVTRVAGTTRWVSSIKRQGVTRKLGVFATAEEAAAAYDKASIAYGGGVLRLNLNQD